MENEDRLFRYFNGAEHVFGDPMTVHRLLTRELGGDPSIILEQSKKDDPLEWTVAQQSLFDAVRVAFGMAAFDKATGDGATDDDCQNAFCTYCDFLEKKNLSTPSTPTS